MVTQPWLSVIMPTYNGEAHLAAALDSICAQKDTAIEVIAVDDGSTDSTADMLQAYARKLALKVIRREHLGNWVAGTNHGLSAARGEWVSFLHQDDIWLPGRLAVLKKIVYEKPDLTLVLHASGFIDNQNRQLGLWRCPLSSFPEILPSGKILERLLIQNFIAIPAPLFKRFDALRVGGMDEALWYTADWDYWLKLAAIGKTAYHPAPLAALRVHPRSQTLNRSIQAGDFRQQLETVLERHLGRWEALNPCHCGLRQAARFSLELNTRLAASFHGHRSDWLKLSYKFLRLGPLGWRRFLRDSRIVERVSARLRAGLSAPDRLQEKKSA